MSGYIGMRATIARRAAILSLCLGAFLISACDDAKMAGTRPPATMAKASLDRNSETYEKIIDNPFQQAAIAPFSTFSSDVDTASYSNVRRFLMTERKLPPKDAVRIEEMMNYFTYSYAPPADEHPIAIHPELTACPWNAKHKLLRIGVQTKFVSSGEMPPRNFVFLLDVSGSMNSENRLPLLKKSLGMLVEQLNGQDRVSIVVYAGSAGLVLPATTGDKNESILRAINQLEAGGTTNGGQGIQLAYKLAVENFIPGGVNRVIIGTDGDFNVGITSPDELVKLIESKRKEGVYLSVLGFGMGNLKDRTFEKLAHHGNGHYAYIDNLDEAQKLFVDQGAALVTVAKDVKFQVEFNPAHVGAYRLIGYENRVMRNQNFADDQKDAGDLGSGHTVTVLYELIPPGEPIPDADPDAAAAESAKPSGNLQPTDWARIQVRYKDPEQETSRLLSVPVRGSDLALMPSADTQFAAAVAGFGMLLRDSRYKGNATFSSVLELARNGQNATRNEYRDEFLKLVQTASERKNAK